MNRVRERYQSLWCSFITKAMLTVFTIVQFVNEQGASVQQSSCSFMRLQKKGLRNLCPQYLSVSKVRHEEAA